MNSVRKCIAMLLCIILLAGLTPVVTMATVGIEQGKTANITKNVTVIGFAGYEWYVIDTGSDQTTNAGENRLTLLAKNSIGESGFRRIWSDQGTPSDVGWKSFGMPEKWYQGDFTYPSDYNDSFLMRELATITNALPPEEADMIISRDLGTNGIGGIAVNNQKLWPLSEEEYNKVLAGPSIVLPNSFWSRTAYGGFAGHVGGVSPGHLWAGYAVGYYNLGILPALYIDTAPVLFTSDATAEGGKNLATVGGGLVDAATLTDTKIKFTFKENNTDNLNLLVADQGARTVAQSRILMIDYSGAVTGAGKYVSCIITGTNGVEYYGKLATAESGRAVIDIPADMPIGDYVLHLFNEQCNGENYSDFASIPISILLTVTAPAATYDLTVIGGVDNANNGPYEADTTVSITAAAAPSGMAFDQWVSDNGGTFADKHSADTTFTMPASDVTVTALYTNATPPANISYSSSTRETTVMAGGAIFSVSVDGNGMASLYPTQFQIQQYLAHGRESGFAQINLDGITSFGGSSLQKARIFVDPTWFDETGDALLLSAPGIGLLEISDVIFKEMAKEAGNVEFSIQKGSIVFEILRNGKALAWDNAQIPTLIAMPYTPPQDISIKALRLYNTQTDTIIKDSYYKDGYIYGNVTTTGKFDAKVAELAAYPTQGTVIGSRVNIRRGAGLFDRRIGRVVRNTSLTVTSIEDNWYAIEHSTGTAYISADYVSVSFETPLSGSVTADTNLYGDASAKNPLGAVEKDDVLNIVGREGKYYLVDWAGETCFVSASSVAIQ